MTDPRALSAELDAVLRPPARAIRDPHAAFDERARSKIRAMVDAARADGMSWNQIARQLDCTLRHLQDVYEGNRRVPAWMIEQMPEATHEHAIRLWIAQLGKVG